jgi:hypothetical protein
VPTFERLARFDRECRRLLRELQQAFLAMPPLFVAALKEKPPAFPPALRVHRVQGATGIWEITFAPDGRATFQYGEQVLAGEPHVIWRRVGHHGVLDEPYALTRTSLVAGRRTTTL